MPYPLLDLAEDRLLADLSPPILRGPRRLRTFRLNRSMELSSIGRRPLGQGVDLGVLPSLG